MKKEELRRLCERFAEFATEKLRDGRVMSFGQKVKGMRFVDDIGESRFEAVLEPRLSDGAVLPEFVYDFCRATVTCSRNRNDTMRYRYILKSYANEYAASLRSWGIGYADAEDLDLKLTVLGF